MTLLFRSTIASAALFVALAPLAMPAPVQAQETAVAPEKNPPGDIPDNQVFITYAAPQGFSLKVPEGWARTDKPDGVSFADKYGTIEVSVASATSPLTVASVRFSEGAEPARKGHAIKIGSVKETKLPGGPAVVITFTSNSAPNAVTGRQIR